jgi:hypothetical protein
MLQSEQNRTEQNRTEQSRAEQRRTEENRGEQRRTEENTTEHKRAERCMICKAVNNSFDLFLTMDFGFWFHPKHGWLLLLVPNRDRCMPLPACFKPFLVFRVVAP